MRISIQRVNNLLKLLKGLSLLEDRDREQIANVVNALNSAYKNEKSDKPLLKVQNKDFVRVAEGSLFLPKKLK